MMTLPTIRQIVPPKGTGFNVRHKTVTSKVVLIPLMWVPMLGDSLRICNLCRMVHPVKTIHLQLDDNGRATVSFGVLEQMRRAGLKRFGFVYEGSVAAPPTLRLDNTGSRAEVDYTNRASSMWGAASMLGRALKKLGGR